MPARSAYNINMGGGQQWPARSLTSYTTLPDSAFWMELPIPTNGSIIRTYNETYTHPKGRSEGTTYKPATKPQAAQPHKWKRLG